MNVLKDKAIALVVTGGIAAYKTAELARLLIRGGARVRTAMTESACRFITPLTLQTLTGEAVITDLWADETPDVTHISLADWADAVVIAPATANIIGKMAGGIADDYVSTFLLAVRAPILVCPSMNVNMYDHPAVQENLGRLQERGCNILSPAAGYLACGWEGRGRLPEPVEIVETVKALLSPRDMVSYNVVVTAGPTREAWDDIRFISNRSSGQMGFALADAARIRGANVTLISGPVALDPPFGVKVVKVESTRDMLQAVRDNLDGVDILVKAAAPGDFRPAGKVEGKIKKTGLPAPVELARNPDILGETKDERKNVVTVGFAAESESLLENAIDKLKRKDLDLIVANQIGNPNEAFGAETNRVWVINRQSEIEEIPLAAKEEIAWRIWDRAVALAAERNNNG